MSAARLTIIVPTLNEAGCVGTVLEGLIGQSGVDQVLVVDGGSTDGTQDIVRAMGIDLLVQTEPGLGIGLHMAFAAVDTELLGIVDADGSHDWTAIPRMRELLDSGYDYVLGSRYLGPFQFRGPLRWPWSTSEDDTWLHEWGNLGIVAMARVLHGYPLHDVMMGMQIWRREALDGITLVEAGQVFDAEIKIKLHRAGRKMGEVSVVEPPRIAGDSKLNALTDGWATARVLVGEWVRGGCRRVSPVKPSRR